MSFLARCSSSVCLFLSEHPKRDHHKECIRMALRPTCPPLQEMPLDLTPHAFEKCAKRACSFNSCAHILEAGGEAKKRCGKT
eukprot:6159917-Amphidinium_carterae.1